MRNKKEMSSKERLMILADLIADVCSYEEIIMLCTGLLDASLKVRRRKQSNRK